MLAEYHARFRYILVDEYQDSNVAQYLWLRLLAQGKPASEANVCVVGDDDQSIYGWRGAEVDNILRFEKDFPGAKVIRLERNYRSTSNILARRLAPHRPQRVAGSARRCRPMSARWATWSASPRCGTARRKPARSARRSSSSSATAASLNDIAILVRASYQMREFEERFITLGLNYRVIGGPRFYERREIRDALAYLRLVANQADDLAFERIINTPKRGIGDSHACKTALRHRPRHRACRCSAPPALLLETEELKPKQRTTLRDLIAQFDDWAERAAHHPARRARPADPRRDRLHRDVAGRQIARQPRPARKPQGARQLDGGVRNARRLPRTHRAWSWTATPARPTTPSRS